MRRLLTLTGAWLAAAIVAAGVAWQGVRLVSDQVTDARPPSLTEEQIAAAVADANSDAADETATTPTTSPPTTAGAAPDGPAPVVRGWELTGGSVSLSFAPSGVTVVFARPHTGYQVRPETRDDGSVRVEFDGPEGRSRIEGWWDGGPQFEIDDDGAEHDDDGGGGPGPDSGNGSGGGSGPG